MYTDIKDGEVRILADENDQCGTCRYIGSCVFITALAAGATELIEEITVDSCCFYAPRMTLLQGGLTSDQGQVSLEGDNVIMSGEDEE